MHQWQMDEFAVKGIVVYLRSLEPKSQGAVDFGGRGPKGDGKRARAAATAATPARRTRAAIRNELAAGAHALRRSAAAIVAAARSALGCDLLPGGDDDRAQPAARRPTRLLPGCEADRRRADRPSLHRPLRGRRRPRRSRRARARSRLRSRSGATAPRSSAGSILPDGAQIDTASMDEWTYPVGTKVWKEFRSAGKRIETRFMQKVRDDRWVQARLRVVAPTRRPRRCRPRARRVDLGGGATYVVPKSSECNDCHKGRKDKLLGFEAISARSARRERPHARRARRGGPAHARRPRRPRSTIADDGTGHAAQALAWLHVNCGTSCHTGTSTATAYGTGLRLRIGWDEISGKPPAQWEVVKSTVGVPVKSPKWAGELAHRPRRSRARASSSACSASAATSRCRPSRRASSTTRARPRSRRGSARCRKRASTWGSRTRRFPPRTSGSRLPRIEAHRGRPGPRDRADPRIATIDPCTMHEIRGFPGMRAMARSLLVEPRGFSQTNARKSRHRRRRRQPAPRGRVLLSVRGRRELPAGRVGGQETAGATDSTDPAPSPLPAPIPASGGGGGEAADGGGEPAGRRRHDGRVAGRPRQLSREASVAAR